MRLSNRSFGWILGGAAFSVLSLFIASSVFNAAKATVPAAAIKELAVAPLPMSEEAQAELFETRSAEIHGDYHDIVI